MNKYQLFAKSLALEAGAIMSHYFEKGVAQREKADKTLVTTADEEINQLVIDRVAEAHPEHAVYGEEQSTTNQEAEFVWSCDPVDGTFLFAKGVPCNVFSLALTQHGQPIVGVVYDPYMKRMFSAVKGSGAFLNDQPIKVSDKSVFDYSLALDMEYWPGVDLELDNVEKHAEKKYGLDFYAIGSVTYCCMLVAWGRFDGVVFAGGKGKSVDVAAAKVIVEEAGGRVTDIDGNDQRYDGDINGCVITNGLIHENMISLIKEARQFEN